MKTASESVMLRDIAKRCDITTGCDIQIQDTAVNLCVRVCVCCSDLEEDPFFSDSLLSDGEMLLPPLSSSSSVPGSAADVINR